MSYLLFLSYTVLLWLQDQVIPLPYFILASCCQYKDFYFLNGHVVKLHSKYVSSNPYIYAAFSLGQKRFLLLQWVIVNTETQLFTVLRMGHWVLSRRLEHLYWYPDGTRLREHGRAGRNSGRTRGCCEMLSSGHDVATARTNLKWL